MRLVAKIVLLVFTLTLLLSFMTCFVASADMPTPNQVAQKETRIDTDAEGGITGVTSALLRYLNILGAIAAVLILAVYGVKWFLATPQQKAILKEQAWSYVIGSILVFGGATLMVWIATSIQSAFGGGQ